MIEHENLIAIFWGWKMVAKALSVKDVRTAQRIAYRYNMPLMKIRGRVCISEIRFRAWWEGLERKAF